jgi:hypothetical protein
MRFTRREIIRMGAAAWAGSLAARAADQEVMSHVLWREPGDAGEILRYGPSGRDCQPQPPFRFEEEDLGGTNPKIKVSDASGAQWILKWGKEVNAEAFASRLAACGGYFVRTAIYMPNGRIEGVRDLGRAAACVDSSGQFEDAVMKLIAVDKPYAKANWGWRNNPFLKNENELARLNGLKVVLMLVSNWDNKDASDPSAGPNTAIYEEQTGPHKNYLYAFDDWGATMGRWGGIVGRSKWDAEGFAEQSGDLVTGQKGGFLEWGYNGKNASELKDGIRPEDLRQLMHFLIGLTETDISAGLEACGANEQENRLFTQALVSRMRQLWEFAT